MKEEKERGITIDLGFAYMPLPSGPVLSIIDVPGHERFVRNMDELWGQLTYFKSIPIADRTASDNTLPR